MFLVPSRQFAVPSIIVIRMKPVTVCHLLWISCNDCHSSRLLGRSSHNTRSRSEGFKFTGSAGRLRSNKRERCRSEAHGMAAVVCRCWGATTVVGRQALHLTLKSKRPYPYSTADFCVNPSGRPFSNLYRSLT